MTSIGEEAFYGCSSLTGINVSGGNRNFKTINGDLYTKDGKTLIQYAYGKKDTNFCVPDSVTSIGRGAFYGCRTLTSVTIPDSVMSIGDYAFYDCRTLTSVTIGNGVTSIGEYAFHECSSLTGVYITDIAAWCKIHFKTYYDSHYTRCCNNPLYYAHNLYLNNELVTELTIPDGVTSIGSGAFSGCSSLTSITIPDSVTSIGDWAFYDCKKLTSVTIGNGVKGIGSGAFSGCSSLTSITIPDSVTSIGDWAFSYCSSLTSITISDTVTSIGDYAFDGCNSLTDITYNGTIEEWKNIEKGVSWRYYAGKFTVHCTDGDLTKEEA